MEQLFRKAAGKQEFEYNDAAWQQMEQLLDARRRRRRIFFWWWRGTGMLLFVAMLGLGIYHFAGEGTSDVPHKTQGVSIPAAPYVPEEPPTSLGQNNTTNESEALQDARNHRQVAPVSTDEEMVSQFRVSAISGMPGAASLTQQGLASGYLAPELDKRVSEPDALDQQSNAASEKVLLSGVLIPHLPMKALEIEASLPELNPEFPPHAGRNAVHDAVSGFYLALAAGGELNSIGPDDFSSLNAWFGLGLEYRINPKWGVASGINYMRLDYRAGEGEYLPPKGFWTRKIAPQSTIGHCNILELPLRLYYHTELESGAGFSLSAGLSSLLIFRQRYYYQYDLADDDLIRKWKSNQLKTYWLSLGSLSVGYDLPLNSKTRLEIAPYLQLPITGIGHGNVQLYGAGIAARLGWKL